MTKNKIDTGTDHLLAEMDSGVLTITLNRPEARNAMSKELVLALVDQLKDAQQNSMLDHAKWYRLRAQDIVSRPVS